MVVTNTKKIKTEFLAELEKAKNEEEIENLRVKYLGRKGVLTELLKELKSIDISKRKEVGANLNTLKNEITEELANKKKEVKKAKASTQEKVELDITAPGIKFPKGTLHPTTLFFEKALNVFKSLGFEIFESPEIDNAFYNFDALNVPKGHPARDAWDTFYIEDGRDLSDNEKLLLRPHTSNAQVRAMESRKPPVRIVSPGKCFRNEATDASHETTFYQLEGFVIDKGISVSNLIGTLNYFAKKMFGEDIETRFRPHFYPFTEPSIDMDISCFFCKGKGCRFCKHSGWIEVMPCGMINPNVLRTMGIDPEVYSGFAFGFGIDRLVMLYYGIEDIRLLHSGDLRFLKQF